MSAFEHYLSVKSDNKTLSSNWITSLFIDNNNKVWVGTLDGGLNEFLVKEKKFIRFFETGGSNSKVNCIYQDKNGFIWIGTNKGIGKVNETNHTIDFEAAKNFNLKTNKEVYSIYQDYKKDYWIGTEGAGLFMASNDFQSFRNFHVKDGLPSNVIFGILPDPKGMLWLSTNHGLSRLNPLNFYFQNFDTKNGLQSNEFNLDAQAITKNGELLFGGVNGFNSFKFSNIDKDLKPVPLIISTIKHRSGEILLYSNNKDKNKTAVLNYDDLPITINFAVLNFSKQGNNNISYRLKPDNNEWISLDNNRNLTLNNIEPNTYLLEVKLDDSPSGETTFIKLIVLPPWYRTSWAYSIYALLVLGILWGIVHYSKLRIKDRNALQYEKFEREKNESINQLKIQFFTNISHELRTPLTLITGPLEKLKQSLKNTDSHLEDIILIEKNANRLVRLVNSILDFRKNETGFFVLNKEPQDFVSFVEEIFLSFKPAAINRGINYALEKDFNALPVSFDSEKMEIVFYNLLSNAFKFTPNNGTISVKIASNDQKVIVKISDTGVGIAEKHTPLVFEPYYQVEDAKIQDSQMTRGSGIGLALTKQFVELHEGEITLDSQLNQGTTLTVSLPINIAEIPEKIIQDTPSVNAVFTDKKELILEKPINVNQNSTPTILIVEDNIEMRDFITGFLKDKYNIIEASNGKEGLKYAETKMPDLVLCDVMMPEMDGIELCTILKKGFQTSHIPVILLTAKASEDFEKTGLISGADDYVTKPFVPSLLELRIKNILDSRLTQQQYFNRNLYANPSELTITSEDQIFLEKAIKVVEDNLQNESFDAELLAKKLNCSKSSLYRKLKGITGQTISEFTRTIRIKRAAQLLLQNGSSIAQVAYEVGFSDLKYFRSCFRKQFGENPSDFVAKSSGNSVL